MRKTTFPAVLSTFIVCYAFWILLTWSFSGQELAVGAVVSLAVALFSARFFIHEKAGWFFRPAKLGALLAYLFVFLGELWKANVDVARRVFGGCRDVNPGVIRIPTQVKGDYPQAMLANCITLTPGTITLDIAEDQEGKSWYYIHWIDVTTTDGEEAGEIIKGKMEKWIRRIWE